MRFIRTGIRDTDGKQLFIDLCDRADDRRRGGPVSPPSSLVLPLVLSFGRGTARSGSRTSVRKHLQAIERAGMTCSSTLAASAARLGERKLYGHRALRRSPPTQLRSTGSRIFSTIRLDETEQPVPSSRRLLPCRHRRSLGWGPLQSRRTRCCRIAACRYPRLWQFTY